jgi:predicted MFS family arabinose efflux permease
MPDQADRTGRLLSDRSFVTFWVCETASLLAMELTRLVLPLVALFALGATALQVGLLNAALYAPIILFSLFIGVWLDRRTRRPTLIVSNLARALLIGLVPLASLTSWLSLAMLYVIAFLVGALAVAFELGSLSYLPGLVGREQLAEANGRIQTSFSLAAIAGPSLGGVMVAAFTAPHAFIPSAVAFAVSALMLWRIRAPEPAPVSDTEDRAVFPAIAEGLRTVFATPLLRNLLTQSAAFNLFNTALAVVFIVYAVRVLGLSPTQLGFVLGAGATAAVAGALLTNRLTQALGLGRTLLGVSLTVCLSPLLLLLPSDAGFGSMAVLVGYEAIAGFHLVIWNINTLTLRQVVTPDRLLGRMNASYRMVLFGTIPLGSLLGGGLGELLGVDTAVVAMVLLMLTPLGWVLFSPVFRLTRMPAEPALAGTATTD